MNAIEADTQAISPLLIALFKGVLYQDRSPELWQGLIKLQAPVRDYIGVLGLELIFDEAEGYAYVRQRPSVEGETEQPRLVTRRQLSYPVSLLLVLLRKKLAEHDASGAEPRLILQREQLVDMMRVFLPDTANEARLMDRIDAHFNKVWNSVFCADCAARTRSSKSAAFSKPSSTPSGWPVLKTNSRSTASTSPATTNAHANPAP
jgi:hypothetical protein